MKKNKTDKVMELAETECKIREILIAKSGKNSEELYRISKETAKSLEDIAHNKALSKKTKRELNRYVRHLEQMSQIAKTLEEFNMLLKIEQSKLEKG